MSEILVHNSFFSRFVGSILLATKTLEMLRNICLIPLYSFLISLFFFLSTKRKCEQKFFCTQFSLNHFSNLH